MPKDGHATRERILSAAESIVLAQGFTSTSVDHILEKTGLTKGAFFHHFKSKDDLALALITRFVENDNRMYEEWLGHAARLSRDPLQRILIAAELMAETYDTLNDAHLGCLLASYCYQYGLMTDDVKAVAKEAMLKWRVVIAGLLREAAKRYPPRVAVDFQQLADNLTVVLEGAYVMARTLNDPKLVAQQLRLWKAHVELLFSSDLAPRPRKR